MADLIRAICVPRVTIASGSNVMESQKYDDLIAQAISGDKSALERLLLTSANISESGWVQLFC